MEAHRITAMRFRNRYNPKKIKPPRKYSLRYMEDELDRLTGLIVRALEPFCFTCGIGVNLQCGHLFERRHRPTRWDIHPEGGNHSQCGNCNALHESKPKIYQDVYIAKFGKAAYDELYRRAHSKQKFTPLELESMVDEYSLKLKELRRAA